MKWLIIISSILTIGCSAQPQQEAKDPPKKKASLTGMVAKFMLGENGGDQHFYMPFRKVAATPARYQLKFEDVHFKSADGTKLFAWFIAAKQGEANAHATIVFSHGNAGSVSDHLGFINKFARDGYNVFLYDYRGYGHSEGKPEKEGIIADAVAAFKYIETRKLQKPIFSVGHSLGGAKSIAALTQYQPKRLQGIAVISAFSSYRKMGVKMVGEMAKKVISNTHNPEDIVQNLPKIPFLVVHGERDQIVPISHGKSIYMAANKPKQFIFSKSAAHNDILHIGDGVIHNKLIQWMKSTLQHKATKEKSKLK